VLNELSGREHIVALAYHVDYWDYLGWKDPYSRSEWTERQKYYAARSGSLYTPQLVVDGRESFVGSDRGKLEQALARSRSRPRNLNVAVQAKEKSGAVEASYKLSGDWGGKRVVLALVADGLVSHVLSGENSGRTLPHQATVLDLVSAPAAAEGHADLLLRSLHPTALVALVQDPDSREILTACRVRLP
jgi:hypothetical protein